MRQRLVAVGFMAAFLTLAGLIGRSIDSAWAVPPDGTYNVGVVATGDTGRWLAGANNLGEAMSTAPGVAPFTPVLIPTASIGTAALSLFDALVVPSCGDRAWVTPGLQAAIAAYVQSGGILIIGPGGSTFAGCTSDAVSAVEPLVQGLPLTHRFTWAQNDWCSITPTIVAPANRLVSFPNVLTPGQIFECDHDSVLTAGLGAAFNVAVTAFDCFNGGSASGVVNDRPAPAPVPNQPCENFIVNAYACGPLGRGAVVIDAHHQSHSTPDFHLLFENMVRLDETCKSFATATPTATATPAINNSFILGAVGAAAGQQAAQNRAAAAAPARPVAPPSTGTGPVITAPSTGDAGPPPGQPLLEQAALAIATAGAAGLFILLSRRVTRGR